jgi:hypothetical protein
MIYNWLIKHRKSAYAIFISFVVFLILVYIFKSQPIASGIYEFIDYWSTPLSTIVVLILAYLAYISIAENRRIREEERDMNFKASSLEYVRRWAQDVLSIVTQAGVIGWDGVYKGDSTLKLEMLEAEKIAVMNEATEFGNKLVFYVALAFERLADYKSDLNSEKARKELAVSISDVLKMAFLIKAKLKR